MSKKIVIYGAGGFGREVQWLIERINQQEPTWEILDMLMMESKRKYNR